MSEELFLCQCGSPDHVFYIEYDEEWKEVFMCVHLRKKSFWERLKYGIKYIFGYQSRYGAFDEVILRQEDLPKLRKVINKAYQYKPVGKKEATGVLKEYIEQMKTPEESLGVTSEKWNDIVRDSIFDEGIDIPFGAFDSELHYQEIYIPDGFQATIEDRKIILKKEE